MVEPASPSSGNTELVQRLESLETRLGAIERYLGIERQAAVPETTPVAPARTAKPAATAVTDTLPLLGRTLLVLGGAFVLRAVTEAELIHPATGAALGIVYAVVWLALADRAAARDSRRSAIWHGIAAGVIAYPLLWEATVEFGFLDPLSACVALTAISAIGLGVAWRHDLRALGWIVTVAAIGAAFGLAVATKLLVLFAAFLLLLGIATLALGYARGWHGPGWLAALAVNGMAGLITAVALQVDPEQAAGMFGTPAALSLQLALAVAYLGCLGAHTLTSHTRLGTAEMIQGVGAIAVGLGGAIALVARSGSGGLALGLATGLLAAVGYAVSFVLVDRRDERTSFIFYSTLALVFAMIGGGELMGRDAFAVALAVAAVLMAWAGAWGERATLSLHGAVYALAGAIVSGLIVGSGRTLLLLGGVERDWLSWPAVAAWAGSVAYCAFPVAMHGRTWGRLSTLPKFLVLLVAVLSSTAALVLAGTALLPAAAAGSPGAGAVAVVRTAVLALAAVALAWLGRLPRLPQAAWLVYPVLVAGGLKLLLEDLRVERPAALVVSFAVYGAALILSPRLLRDSAAKRASG